MLHDDIQKIPIRSIRDAKCSNCIYFHFNKNDDPICLERKLPTSSCPSGKWMITSDVRTGTLSYAELYEFICFHKDIDVKILRLIPKKTNNIESDDIFNSEISLYFFNRE